MHHRTRTGRGQYINLSQFEATAGTAGHLIMEYLANGRAPQRLGNRSLHAAPHGCYRCAGDDRWCAIAVAGVGVLLLVLVACGVGGYMFNKQVPTIIRESTASILGEAKVEPAERQAITQQMERFASAYESNSITWEQIGEIVSELGESPLVDTVILVAVEAQYFDESGLDADEKAAGRSALRRLARGAMDKQIARSEIAQLLDQVTVNPGGGSNNRQLKSKLTDEELREFLTQCKALAEIGRAHV